jgi:hypothetical protein
MQRFTLRRTDFRQECARLSTIHSSLGGTPDWFINIPKVFAALAHPDGTHDFIQLPARGEKHPGNASAYWASLLYLFAYSFGWESPAHGIRWWNDSGFPTDDDRLALVKQVWVDDGMFEYFYEWLMTTQPRFEFGAARPTGRLAYGAYQGEQRFAVNGELPVMDGYHLPYGGGTDPLHLVQHVSNYWSKASTEGCSLILSNDGSPTGVLLADNWSSWWSFLQQSPRLASPHPSGRSWRIEVIVRPFGLVGTFRRSRETGVWFAGKHRFHVAGYQSP